MNFLLPDIHVPLTVTLTSISRQSHPLLSAILQAAIEDTGATIETPCLFPPITEHQAAEIESLIDRMGFRPRSLFEHWANGFSVGLPRMCAAVDDSPEHVLARLLTAAMNGEL